MKHPWDFRVDDAAHRLYRCHLLTLRARERVCDWFERRLEG